jgi:hypothetical protein
MTLEYRDPLPDDPPAGYEPEVLNFLSPDRAAYYRQRSIKYASPRWQDVTAATITFEVYARLFEKLDCLTQMVERLAAKSA